MAAPAESRSAPSGVVMRTGTGQRRPQPRDGRVVRTCRLPAGIVAIALLLLAAPAPTVLAAPSEFRPGSLLVYPLVDSRAMMGRSTTLSITNTNASRMVSPVNHFREGDVRAHYFYVEGAAPWGAFDRVEYLTPNDTLTVVASEHAPDLNQGFLIVLAGDPESERAVTFNYLIGESLLVDVLTGRTTLLPAVPFEALANGQPRSNTNHAFTDLNGNGSADLDGLEYETFPGVLYLDRFFQQSNTLETELILVTLLGRDFRVEMDFLIYDNEEDVFSRTFQFLCWTRVRLTDISQITRSLGGRATEAQTGWMRLMGRYAVNILNGAYWRNEGQVPVTLDPPILGAVLERIMGPMGMEYGHLLHHSGAQNGNEFPPDTEN